MLRIRQVLEGQAPVEREADKISKRRGQLGQSSPAKNSLIIHPFIQPTFYEAQVTRKLKDHSREQKTKNSGQRGVAVHFTALPRQTTFASPSTARLR